MLRIHLLQNWFSLSDPAMEEALYEITPMRQFARLTLSAPIPEDTTIMNFRHLLEKHQLAPAIHAVINDYLQEKGLSLRQGTIVDATIIHAPSSTKNEDGKRDPEMDQTKKGNQYFFGMKAHFGADVESGLVHHAWHRCQCGQCHAGRRTAPWRRKHGVCRRWLSIAALLCSNGA